MRDVKNVVQIEKINSPFRYPGGKFYARNIILEMMPPHTAYCELFAGGASIFFAKTKVRDNILNDKDTELMNCYIQIQNHVEELITLLDNIPATKDNHSFYKNQYKPKNDLERAMRWYYLNRTSYSGIMKTENCYWGYGEKYSMRPENWPRHLRRVALKLTDVKLYMKDFTEVPELSPETFVFVDPPYLNADQDKFYTCNFEKKDHLKLKDYLKELNRNNIKFLLTYDNSAEIREMYGDWCNLSDKAWNYTISRTDDQKKNKKLTDGYRGIRNVGKEVFISNYDHRCCR